MSAEIASPKANAAVIAGDAGLFTAAAFSILAIVAPPLALIAGPAIAWYLHGRRFDRAAMLSGGLGLVIGLLAVGGFFALFSLIAGRIQPSDSEYTVPAVALAVVGVAFVALVVALDVDSLRDLRGSLRQHTQLDVARLISTGVIVVFGGVVMGLQLAHRASEIGDAGIFALGAAAVGCITMLAAEAIYGRWARRGG
jgi:hypothetical protein